MNISTAAVIIKKVEHVFVQSERDGEGNLALTAADLAAGSVGTSEVTDGTLTATDLDVTGAYSWTGAHTWGVDDTGVDVKMFGATSGAYCLWDESADDLKLVGAAGLTVDGTSALTDVTVSTTLAVTGAQTNTVGVQSAAVARTATSDGLTTGTIADGTSYVTVTSASANDIIVLPTPTPGNIVWLNVGATGYELRSDTPTTVAINGGTGSNVESAVGANVLVRAVCTSSTTWVCSTFSTVGTEAALEAAA